MLSDDTVSLRHLPRRSSKNSDLQFANGDRFKANYSVDDVTNVSDGFPKKSLDRWWVSGVSSINLF